LGISSEERKGGVLLLLFIGVHNAWDTVAYRALLRGADKKRLTGVAE
jgi:hypothetical protein